MIKGDYTKTVGKWHVCVFEMSVLQGTLPLSEVT
jgi:hypothetical protein